MTADNEDSLLSSVAQQAGSIRAVCLRAEQQSEATLREQASLLNLTHDAIFVREMNGTIKYWNRGAAELYGWPAEQAVGRVGHVLLKTIFPVSLEQIQEEVIGAGRWEGELVQTRKDGSQVVVSSRLSLQSDERNEPVGIIVINNDITKRKRAEEVARRSEKELRDVVNAVPAFVWTTLPDGALDFVNEHWLEFTGLSLQDALGWNWEATVHPDDRSRVVADWRAAVKNGQSVGGEMRVRRADGEFRWWFLRSIPLHDEAGNIVKWYGTGVDIEDRKRAESLFAGEKRILEMVATGGALAEILESLCRLVEEQAGDVMASILLVDGDHLRHGGALSLPKAYTDAINGIVIGPSAGSCGTAAYRGQPVIVEDIATDPLWADYRELALPHSLCACWSTPVFSSQGKVIATVAMYYREPRRPTQRNQEIIDRITHFAGAAIQQKLAQENLQRSEAYLAQAEKLTHTGSWAWDPRTDKVLYCSEEMYRIFGLDPRKSLPTRENFRQQIHPEDRDWVRKRLERSLRERVDAFAEYRVLLPDGTVRHINASGHPVLDEDGELIEFVGTVVDVTERKRAELERRRLASLVEQAGDLMAINDLNGGTPIYLNEAGMKMVGFESWEEARSRRGIHWIFPEDRQFVTEVVRPTVLEKGSWSGEMRFRHFKTGDAIPVLYSLFRIDDPETGQAVNPNRLEQRFGRIHRIGQTEVCHLWNLCAANTREGEVYVRLLEKLEEARAALGGKVYDVLGELFEGHALRDLLVDAIRYGDRPEKKAELFRKVDGVVDVEAIEKLVAERKLTSEGMNPSSVAEIREQMERAQARRLQPHFIGAFFREAFTMLGGRITEREKGRYEILRVPSILKERDRLIGRTDPVLDR